MSLICPPLVLLFDNPISSSRTGKRVGEVDQLTLSLGCTVLGIIECRTDNMIGLSALIACTAIFEVRAVDVSSEMFEGAVDSHGMGGADVKAGRPSISRTDAFAA